MGRLAAMAFPGKQMGALQTLVGSEEVHQAGLCHALYWTVIGVKAVHALCWAETPLVFRPHADSASAHQHCHVLQQEHRQALPGLVWSQSLEQYSQGQDQWSQGHEHYSLRCCCAGVLKLPLHQRAVLQRVAWQRGMWQMLLWQMVMHQRAM